VREVKDGHHMNGTRWALGPAALAVGTAVLLSLMGGPAQAQDPPPIYDIPTPTPTPEATTTPTPTGTPFENVSPPAPTPTSSGPKFISPFPVVRTAGSYTAQRTTFTRFTVKGPAGTKVSAKCQRARCKLRRTLKSTRTVHIRPLERSYKAGTKIQVRLTVPSLIGKYVSIRIRRGKPPLRLDRCLRPGGTRPVSCGAL
jgi:hypothetical protein